MQKLSLTKKYATYPKYKESGVEWLGETPEGWGLEKLKFLAPLYNKKISGRYGGGVYVALENVESWTGKHLPSVDLVEPESIVNSFKATDVLFGKLRPYLAKVFLPSFSGTSTGEFLVLRPELKVRRDYLFYRLLSPEFIRTVNDSTYGSQMPRANWSFVGNLPITLPPKEEQERIARFLDEQTARIDETIAKKERLIELLKEKRTAVINHAVTKGLDPNAELVDSGIEWIGKIPKGWEVNRLGLIADINASNIDKNTVDGQHVLKVCNYVDVYKNDYISEDLGFLTASATAEQVRKFGLKAGDILLTKDSETADDIGIPAYVNETLKDVVVGYHIYQARVKDKRILPEFVFRFIQSRFSRAWFETKAKGVTRFGLGSHGVKSLPILVPPYAEQEKVSETIKRHSELTTEAVIKIKKSITHLQELKSSLISHAVTGKIKI